MYREEYSFYLSFLFDYRMSRGGVSTRGGAALR